MNFIAVAWFEEALGSGDVHDSVITVPKIFWMYVQSRNALICCDMHHLLVNVSAISVEFPQALLVAHGISNCSEQHRGNVSFFHQYF